MLDFAADKRFLAGLGIFLFFVAQSLASIALYVYGINRREKDLVNKGHDNTGSIILSSHLRDWYFEKLRAFEEFFIKRRFTPNMLTCTGCTFSLAAAVLYHFRWIGAAGWIVLVAGTFDILDGAVARKTNQMTKSGAFFDSVLDRYAEMIVYFGLVSYYFQLNNMFMVWMVLATIVGAQMVSYTRARAETAGVVGKVGIMQRPERFVYLGFGSLFSSQLNALFAPWLPQKQYLLSATIIFIAVMSNLTAYRRFHTAFVELREANS